MRRYSVLSDTPNTSAAFLRSPLQSLSTFNTSSLLDIEGYVFSSSVVGIVIGSIM